MVTIIGKCLLFGFVHYKYLPKKSSIFMKTYRGFMDNAGCELFDKITFIRHNLKALCHGKYWFSAGGCLFPCDKFVFM